MLEQWEFVQSVPVMTGCKARSFSWGIICHGGFREPDENLFMRYCTTLPILATFVVFMNIASAAESVPPIENAGFEAPGGTPEEAKGFRFSGDCLRAFAGRTGKEASSVGAQLDAGTDRNGDGRHEGALAAEVHGLKAPSGSWFRFRFRALPEANFAVTRDADLFMRVEFFAANGKNPLDGVVKELWPLVQQRRRDLDANGLHKRLGAAVWQDYALDFKLPFPDIDMLRLSIGFRNGVATTDKEAGFLVDDLALEAIPAPRELDQAIAAAHGAREVKLAAGSKLVHLGGRWYYEQLATETEAPKTFNATHAARLYYQAGRLEAPFAGNMSAWLRAGFLDLRGAQVKEDLFVPDSVTVSFTKEHLVVKAKNIPNHPTANFPGYLGNPNAIQEQDRTYKFALDPQPNPAAKAMDAKNANRALNMGPVGIATNGVVFYNPFDAGMEEAVDIMDRCCGHPSPDNMYHYHKYPVCVRSPWVDEGRDHSPLIGFAFDGFPIYGPYEKAGVLAKDDRDNPLNAFNLHKDADRGWHYHVTPGKFPYLIGGYYGTIESANLDRRDPPNGGEGRHPGDRPPPGRGPGFGPPPPRGPRPPPREE